MKPIMTVIAIATLWTAGTALAVEMPVAGKAKCGGCHAIDRKVVGPAWKDVAAKYAGKKDAQKTLIANINKGGAFGWKMGVMPPKGGSANDDEIQLLAKFIIGLR